MPKILTDIELCDIIYKAIHDPSIIDCKDSYRYFLEGLADLIETTFGGEAGSVEEPNLMDEWSVAFHLNESVPEDGGIYKDYDKDVTWRDGVETCG